MADKIHASRSKIIAPLTHSNSMRLGKFYAINPLALGKLIKPSIVVSPDSAIKEMQRGIQKKEHLFNDGPFTHRIKRSQSLKLMPAVANERSIYQEMPFWLMPSVPRNASGLRKRMEPVMRFLIRKIRLEKGLTGAQLSWFLPKVVPSMIINTKKSVVQLLTHGIQSEKDIAGHKKVKRIGYSYPLLLEAFKFIGCLNCICCFGTVFPKQYFHMKEF
jgi:hypothetical protein